LEIIDKKQFAQEFEKTLLLSKAKAYSNLSLERKLTEEEFTEYKNTMSEIGFKI